MPDAKQPPHGPMHESDYQHVINELEKLIKDTKQLIERFDSTGMDEEMQEDYDKLLTIYDQAIKDQAHYTQAMLKE